MTAVQRQPEGDDLRRVRVGQFVTRVMDAARERGMTIRQIEQAAKVGKSTMYRWKRGEVVPGTAELLQFADGLGADRRDAIAALGATATDERRPRRTPEPIINDPDVLRLLRKLSSPHTSQAEKTWIRRQIRSMAEAVGESDTEE